MDRNRGLSPGSWAEAPVPMFRDLPGMGHVLKSGICGAEAPAPYLLGQSPGSEIRYWATGAGCVTPVNQSDKNIIGIVLDNQTAT